MPENGIPRPVVTVATIVVREGELLLVEEHTRSGLRFNQPAGHLEAGESIVEAAVRETLEETGYSVAVTALVGIYRWRAAESGGSYVRFAFAADVVGHDRARPLDRGIERAVWLSYADVVACADRHRSPLVLRCIDDHRAGHRWPLAVLTDLD